MAISWTTLTGAKTVVGSIANWVNRSDLPTDNILLEAEAWIYQRLRIRNMMERVVFQFDLGAQTEPLPSDFLDPISFTPYRHTIPLVYLHEEKLIEQRDDANALISGEPTSWAIIGDTAYVDVECSEDFPGILLYYKLPAALSVSNTTNFLTTRYPSLLRYACLARAYEHMKDAQSAQQYDLRAMGALAEAMQTDEMWRRGQYIPAG